MLATEPAGLAHARADLVVERRGGIRLDQVHAAGREAVAFDRVGACPGEHVDEGVAHADDDRTRVCVSHFAAPQYL